MQARRDFHISPRSVRAIRQTEFDCETDRAVLDRLGISFTDSQIERMRPSMDAIQPLITTASMGVPVQFLQSWMPGFVNIITKARKADLLVGLMMTGAWEDEEVVQPILETLGSATPYGDETNVPFSGYNTNFIHRTIVRFEQGMQVTSLDSARAAKMQVNTPQALREACGNALEIQRNAIAFVGYNSGNNLTYGFLNDPGLPNYVNVVAGASSSTMWVNKTYLEILNDIRTAVSSLVNGSGDTIDPQTTDLTLAVATVAFTYLSKTPDYGQTVLTTLKETWPKMRFVSAPELNAANGGANVFYLYAEKVEDQSTDGGRVFVQMVPAKLKTLGVEQKNKSYQEDYSNATAGVMCKRPFAVIRMSGI